MVLFLFVVNENVLYLRIKIKTRWEHTCHFLWSAALNDTAEPFGIMLLESSKGYTLHRNHVTGG
jgi:hypothetical protein